MSPPPAVAELEHALHEYERERRRALGGGLVLSCLVATVAALVLTNLGTPAPADLPVAIENQPRAAPPQPLGAVEPGPAIVPESAHDAADPTVRVEPSIALPAESPIPDHPSPALPAPTLADASPGPIEEQADPLVPGVDPVDSSMEAAPKLASADDGTGDASDAQATAPAPTPNAGRPIDGASTVAAASSESVPTVPSPIEPPIHSVETGEPPAASPDSTPIPPARPIAQARAPVTGSPPGDASGAPPVDPEPMLSPPSGILPEEYAFLLRLARRSDWDYAAQMKRFAGDGLTFTFVVPDPPDLVEVPLFSFDHWRRLMAELADAGALSPAEQARAESLLAYQWFALLLPGLQASGAYVDPSIEFRKLPSRALAGAGE